MSVMFTAEAEKRRQKAAQKRRAALTWELLKTFSLAEAAHFARENGWKEKKVQVRAVYSSGSETEYYVEPYETNCSCPNILKYSDYFD